MKSILGTREYLEQKKGFKYILLGDSISTLNGKIEQTKSYDAITNGVTYYIVNDESLLKVGEDVTIKLVKVGVYKGKIAKVILETEGINGYNLARVFVDAYGAAYQSNRYIQDYFWASETVCLSLNLSIIGFQKASIEDLAIRKELRELESEQTKKAASGL